MTLQAGYVPAETGENEGDYTAIRREFLTQKQRLVTALANGNLNRDLWENWLTQLSEKYTDIDFMGHWKELTRIDLSGRQFRKKLRCDGLRFPGEVNFAGSKFSRGADFTGAEFFGDSIFASTAEVEQGDAADDLDRQVRFSYEALFKSSIFHGLAKFAGCNFGPDVDFQSAIFRGFAEFSDSKFERQANFELADFQAGVSFREMSFTGKAKFAGCTFAGHTDFNEAQFRDDASFDNVTIARDGQSHLTAVRSHFHQSVSLNDARLYGACDFSQATFEIGLSCENTEYAPVVSDVSFGPLDFTSATFAGPLNFGRSIIGSEGLPTILTFNTARFITSGRAAFEKMTVNGNLDLSEATVEKPLSFHNSKINGLLLCEGTRFRRHSDFEGIEVDGRSDFRRAEFTDVKFKNAKFGDPRKEHLGQGKSVAYTSDFSGARFNGSTDFEDCEFAGDAVFRGMVSKGVFDLKGVKFVGVVPDFALTHFDVVPALSEMTFEPPLATKHKNYADQYNVIKSTTKLPERFRALRSLAIKGHDIDSRRDFSRLEMLSSKGRVAEEYVERIFELVARSGYSFIRPVVLLLSMALIVFPLAYVWIGDEHLYGRLVSGQFAAAVYAPCKDATQAGFNPISGAYYISLRNTVIVGPTDDASLQQADQCLYGSGLPGFRGAVARLLPYGQLILSFIFLFLAALGIRHRLRINNTGD